MGYSPYEIENPHSEIRMIQWATMHGMGTHRLSEIEVKGVDDLLNVNANCERPGYTPYIFFLPPPDQQVTEFLDMRSAYISEIADEVKGGSLAAALSGATCPYVART